MTDDVDAFYTDSISNESRCTSLEVLFRAARSGGFIDFAVQNLSG